MKITPIGYQLRLLIGISMTLALPLTHGAFTDATSETGIVYQHATVNSTGANHAGAAAVDVNGDGWTDVFGARVGEAPVVFMNQGDGTFIEDAVGRGLAGAIDAAAFGAGDFDNDGDQDLFVTPREGYRFRLYINDGTGHFTEDAIARNADVATSTHPHSGYSVGLVDYDNDGYLDIYASERGVNTSVEDAAHSVLLRNRGLDSPAHFENATAFSGLQQPRPGNRHLGFSSGWADFDGDGWQDLALVADFNKSQLFWNNGDGLLRSSRKNLASSNTLHPLRYIRGTVARNRSHQKVGVIAINSDLQKTNFPPFPDVQTDFLEQSIDAITHHNSTVFRRTH